MAIVRMKQLRLAAMRAQREELLRLLQGMGCVEVSEPEPDGDDPVWSALIPAGDQGLSVAREGYLQAERALEILKEHAPQKGKLLAPRPDMSQRELLDRSAAQGARDGADKILELDRRLSAIQAEENKVAAQRQRLAPWLGLDMPLETGSTAQVAVALGTLPGTVSLEQGRAALEQQEGLAQLTEISADREYRYCLLICHRSQEEQVLEQIKALGWSRAELKDWRGTAADNDAALSKELEQLDRERQQLEAQLAQLGGLRPQLQRLSDLAHVDEDREAAKGRMLDTEQTFYLEGWIPAERWPELQKALEPYPCALEVTDPKEEDYPKVPVELKNNWFTRPLNMVTEMYSLPAYGSLDPNPLMAPFFILFYGIMMADMGYGLLMFLLGGLVLLKKKPGGTLGHMCGLLMLCGVSTFAMGILTGGFFGDFLTQLAKLIDPESTFALPALFTPLDDTMAILIGAMCLGFIQIVTGMAISFVKKLKEGKVMDAIWEEVTWWVVFAGLALAALGVTNWVIALGGVMVVAGPMIEGKGFGKITGIFGSLYNHITGYFGDILSYSRLMALMLAGSVIAQVFNTLGAIPGNILIFLAISFVGNALNFALNLLGCYVHDLRLQCLEYFGKFYEDGGRPFRPLDMDTKYYNVVK